MDAGTVIAVLGTSVAAYNDLKYQKIPNSIPASMLLISFPLAFLGGYILPWVLNIILSAIIFYVFWMLRVWAAGDSKLLIAVAALIPQYPTTVLPQPSYSGFFFLTVVFNLLLVYLIYTIFLIFRRSPAKTAFALILCATIILFVAAYDLGFTFAVPFLFSFLVYRIYSEAVKLELTRTVPALELQLGDNLAERIVEEGGRIIREKDGPASVSSLLGRLMDGDVSSPSSYGVTEEEKDRLLGLVAEGKIEDGIRIYSGTVMSPMILVALVLSVTLGDILSVIL